MSMQTPDHPLDSLIEPSMLNHVLEVHAALLPNVTLAVLGLNDQ